MICSIALISNPFIAGVIFVNLLTQLIQDSKSLFLDYRIVFVHLQEYPKLSQSYYALLEILAQDHMNFLSSLEPQVSTRIRTNLFFIFGDRLLIGLQSWLLFHIFAHSFVFSGIYVYIILHIGGSHSFR